MLICSKVVFLWNMAWVNISPHITLRSIFNLNTNFVFPVNDVHYGPSIKLILVPTFLNLSCWNSVYVKISVCQKFEEYQNIMFALHWDTNELSKTNLLFRQIFPF